MSKAVVVFIDKNPYKGYLLTNFNQTEDGISGFVENGLWDMKIDDHTFISYYPDGRIAEQYQIGSYDIIHVEYDGDDYNEPIIKAMEILGDG